MGKGYHFVIHKQQNQKRTSRFPVSSEGDFMRSFRFVILLLFLLTPSLLYAQNSGATMQQGILHYELKEYDEAIHYFEQALQFQQFSPEIYIYLTSSHLLNQNPEEAIQSSAQGLDNFPDALRLRMMMGEALIQTDLQQAIPLFEDVLQQFSVSGKPQIQGVYRKNVEAYLSRIYQQSAVTAFQKENFSQAEGYYKKARTLNPDSLSVHNNLAYILIQQEKWGDAEEALNVGLSHFPSSENLLLMKAQVLEQRDEREEMLNILERLYHTNPSNMNRAVLYGKSLLSANRADEANEFFRKKIRDYPQERILYETLLEVNRQRFNQTGVLEVLRLQKEQFPDDEKVLEEYGLELITAQKYADASAWFDSLAVSHNNPEYGKIAARSWLYEEDFETAETVYRKQIKRWPQEALLLSDFAIVLKKNGKTEEATEVFETILKSEVSGNMRIEYAEMLTSYQDKEKILQPLNGTLYNGWARWFLLKDHPKEAGITESAEYIDILSGMIAFYEDRKILARSEVEAGLQTFRAPNPPLFQVSSELKKIDSELKGILAFLNRVLPFEKAEGVILKTLHKYPESALLMHHMGMLYYQNNRIEDAQKNFENAVQLQADREKTHLFLGHVYQKAGQFDKAVLSYERVLTINDRDEEAYRSLIRLHQRNGELDQLCSRWLRRHNHQKQNDVLREFLIDALHRANQFEEVRALLD